MSEVNRFRSIVDRLRGRGRGAQMGAQMETPPQAAQAPTAPDAMLDVPTDALTTVGEQELIKANRLLVKYQSGKASIENRAIAAEQMWKLRLEVEINEAGEVSEMPSSAWLFNCIISKHADGIEAFPEPNVLPRELGDKPEAKKLSSILPVVMDQNDFDEVYSEVLWQKLKQGTGIYGVFWDKDKLGGLGDISIRKIDVLSIFWEPGVKDIQRSRNIFTTELVDVDILRETYPAQLANASVIGKAFTPQKYRYDDTDAPEDKAVVVDWYYRKGGVLHYCKYVDTTVLYATENDPVYAERGLYDHAMYPFVFDPLFPVEGSPCGYGYIDVGRGPQNDIDRISHGITMNALMSATKRWFTRNERSINLEQFADWRKPFVTVTGQTLGEDDLREISVAPLPAQTLQVLQDKITELKETTGNRDANTGGSAPGVTAASAIAAMQEQAGKTSRASTLSAYRAYGRVIDMCIELIRQFYTDPRQFRIIGENATEEFISFTNQGIQPAPQQIAGADMGMRTPAFDVDVSAQKMNAYTKMAQNELVMQLFKMGLFNPQNGDVAQVVIDAMDFPHKDIIEDKIRKNATMYQMLAQYMQMALTMAIQSKNVEAAEMIAANIQQVQAGLSGTPAPQGGTTQLAAASPTQGAQKAEAGNVSKARAQSQNAAQPNA